MADDKYIKEYKNIVRQIASKIQVETFNNYYPIMQTYIGKHNGIEITGSFETDDSSTDGRMSYVTVLRDGNALDPSNGLGFGWMKGDGTIYNVYLVDNSPLANDLFVNENFIIQPQGDNAWKAAEKVVIDINTTYRFRLTIAEDFSMDLRIWEDGGSEPVTATVHCGGTATGPAAYGTNFGVGVLGTQNSEWWYDDFQITTTTGVHTAVVFKLKARTTDFPNGQATTFNWYGYGSDGAVVPNYGASAFMWTQVSGIWGWKAIGTNTATNATNIEASKISYDFTMGSTYRDTNQFCNFLITSTQSAGSVTNVTSYYTNLQTTVPSGVHTGGCADIYINDPTKILLAQQTINNVTGTVDLSAANGFYLPIHSIVEVQTGIIGNTLSVNTDWVLVTPNIATAYSTQEYPYISFNPALSNLQVLIKYRYWENGANVQTLLESPTYRYSGTSNLAKMIPPTIVNVNQLEYKGPLSETVAKLAIKTYINEATGSISLSEIVNLLYSYGAVYVDIPNADITVTAYDYKRVIQDPVQLLTTYSLGTLTAFFADDTSLSGVRKV